MVRAGIFVFSVVALLTGLAIAPALATPVFNIDLTFADGRTGLGTFTLRDYVDPTFGTRYLEDWDITTGDSLTFTGYEYDKLSGDPSAQFSDNNMYLTFNRAGYHGFLVIKFNAPFDPFSSSPLNLTGSFECDDYQSGNVTDNTCGHQHAPQLLDAAIDQIVAPTAVPEPAALALFGAGLLVLGVFCRRKATA